MVWVAQVNLNALLLRETQRDLCEIDSLSIEPLCACTISLPRNFVMIACLCLRTFLFTRYRKTIFLRNPCYAASLLPEESTQCAGLNLVVLMSMWKPA